MKGILKAVLILLLSIAWISNLKAQTKFTFDNKPKRVKPFVPLKQSEEDSLYKEFNNTIYYTYYNSSYIRHKTPVFTLLKVDID